MTAKIYQFRERYLPSLDDSIVVELPDGTHKTLICDGFKVMDEISLVVFRMPRLFRQGDICFYNKAKIGDTCKISVWNNTVKAIRPL